MTHPTHRDPLAELRRKTVLENRHNAKVVELLSIQDPFLHDILRLDATLALLAEEYERLARAKTASAGRSMVPVSDQETLDGGSEE